MKTDRRREAHDDVPHWLPVTEDELDDIERYLNATRSELMFAKGVILVEGDAEEALLPSFAESISINLDRKGISVCNVAGTNFTPYVNSFYVLHKIR